MSMLGRFKKPGGFQQLLTLIESFGPQKREKFMEMIQAEDAAWGRAIASKLMNIDRILGWPEQTLSDIFKSLPVRQMACVMKSVSAEHAAKISKFMSHADLRKLEGEMTTMEVKPEEAFATFVRVIELTRSMIKSGHIRIDRVDPEMFIPENFEDKLSSEYVAPVMKAKESDADAITLHRKGDSGESEAKLSSDLTSLHKTLAAVSNENKILKNELKSLRDKLDQIKRIA